MYSDMSMRTIACSSSNRNAASALVSSVLPTPVGPRNMNEPIGRFGSCKPARARRTAVDTATTASCWPTTRLADHVLHAQKLLALALQHPVDRHAGPARDDLRDVIGRHRLLDHRRLAVARFDRSQLLLQLGDDAIGQLAGAREVAAALRLLELDAALVELLLELLRVAELVLLALPAFGQRSANAPRGRRSPFRCAARRSLEASSVSFFSASRSILSCIARRSISSSSSGLESTCILRRDAASSTRSIALSGRKRSVM